MKKTFYCALSLLLGTLFLTGCTSFQDSQLEVLGEGYYIYEEFDLEISFETISERLAEQGYSLTPLPSHLEEDFPGETLYTAKKNDENHEALSKTIYITQCESNELAKEVFDYALSYSNLTYKHYVLYPPFERETSIIRVNNCVYTIVGRTVPIVDLLTILNIPLPKITPLYAGGIVELSQELDYDVVADNAKKAGYIFYDAIDYQDVFQDCFALVSPEKDAYLFLVRTKDLDTQSAKEHLNGFMRADTPEYCSMKLVMFSEDAFVIGTSYHVDRFVERISAKTTGE